MSEFTFNGFEPANTTPVPDVLFDELLTELTGAELKVLLYIIRRTAGFKKPTDAISLSQFQKGIITKDGKQLDKGCGIGDRQTIIDALASLEKKNCIIGQRSKTAKGDNATTVYHICFRDVVGKNNHGSMENPTTLDGKNNHGSRQKSTTVVGDSNPQETVLQLHSKQESTYPRESHSDDFGSSEPTRTLALMQDEPSHAGTTNYPGKRWPDGSLTPDESRDTDGQDNAGALEDAEEHPSSSQGREQGIPRDTGQSSPASEQVVPTGHLSTSQASSPQASAKVETTNGRRRQPKAPTVDPGEIQNYLGVFDRLFQEVTGDPDAGYICSGEDRKELIALLEANLKKPRYVTPEKLRVVYLRLWNKPKDDRTGFHWQEHMKIKNVCKQYPQEAMTLSAQANQKAASKADANTTSQGTVSGLRRLGSTPVAAAQH